MMRSITGLTGLVLLLSAPLSFGQVEDPRPKLTILEASRPSDDTIVALLPNICFDSGDAEVRTAVQTWLDGIRVVQLPTAGAPDVVAEAIEVEKVRRPADGDCFFKVELVSRSLNTLAEYRVFVGALTQGRNVIIKPGLVTLPPRKLDLNFDRLDAHRIEVTTPTCLPDNALIDSLEVVLSRGEEPDVELSILAATQSGEDPGPCLIWLYVDEALTPGTTVKVSVTAAPLGALAASQKVKFPVPSNKAESELFVEVTAEAGEDQKPTLLIDFRFDRESAVEFGENWTLGIDLGAEISTKSADETNKLHIAYPFHRKWIFSTASGVVGIYGAFAPRLEAEDIFANRNIMADVSFEVVSSRLHGAIGDFDLTGGKDLRWRYGLTPTLGYQWGENQSLEDDDLRNLEGYSLSRGMAGASFELKREVDSEVVESVSFNLTYSGWYRFSRELDTFTDAEGESAVRLEDGYVDYWTVALDLRLSESFGVVLKYQTGERPVLFKDEDKASLGISYRM